MNSGKYTCKDQRVPKQSTGRTPVRNLRVPDERWLPALAKAEAEGRTLTEVIDGFLADYASRTLAGAHLFTRSNWPGAVQWIDIHAAAIEALQREIEAAVGELPPEWLSIAAWLASTRHPADPVQQRRVLAGHIIGRAIDAPPDADWRARYRDTRHLLDTIQQVLDRRMPLSQDKHR
jgi:hypothetical protein